MANSNTTQQIEALAAEIGENVYIDIAKWHLYLSDAHLHTVVAEKVYPLLVDKELTEDAVTDILRQIPVKLGAGRRELSLIDLIPNQCESALYEVLENYQNDL
ncbi:MAG: DUF3181 family protein [Microcystaceae cyanobacterium]